MTADNTFGAGIAFCEEKFVPIDEARIPLLDWGFLRSDAVQDTVSVFHGSFFRGVIPITKVGGDVIGSGQPGPVTRRLDDLYWSKRRAGWLTTPINYDAPLQFDPR